MGPKALKKQRWTNDVIMTFPPEQTKTSVSAQFGKIPPLRGIGTFYKPTIHFYHFPDIEERKRQVKKRSGVATVGSRTQWAYRHIHHGCGSKSWP